MEVKGGKGRKEEYTIQKHKVRFRESTIAAAVLSLGQNYESLNKSSLVPILFVLLLWMRRHQASSMTHSSWLTALFFFFPPMKERKKRERERRETGKKINIMYTAKI